MGSPPPRAQAPHLLGICEHPLPRGFPGCPAHPPSHSPLQPSTTPELALCPGVPWWGAGGQGGQRLRPVGTGGLQAPRVASLGQGPSPMWQWDGEGGLRVSPAMGLPSRQDGCHGPCDVRAPGVSPPASGLGISLSGCWGWSSTGPRRVGIHYSN